MKLKLVALSTWFVVALTGCTLNPIGEDPGINRDSNDNAAAGEGSPNDGAFAPGQGMSNPEAVDPTSGLPVAPGEQEPAPVVIDPGGEAPPEDIISEPEAAPEDPILPSDPPIAATTDGGVPFGDAGDAGDAAVPSGAR